MLGTVFQWVIAYLGMGTLILYLLTFDKSDFEECGFITCVLLWPVILLGILITGLMKICKVIAREWNEG